MDTIGLLNRIAEAVEAIDKGRRGLATKGSAEEGLAFYQDGLSKAMAVFQEGAVSGDARTLILVDHAYVTQEIQFCDTHDADARNSLNAAITGFDDALRVLPTINDAAAYQTVETSYPHAGDYRVNGMPKDAYHVACIAHKVRLRNALRTPGLAMTEKALYKQRLSNMGVAQGVYFALQEAALELEKNLPS
jgi:hypothetical protein